MKGEIGWGEGKVERMEGDVRKGQAGKRGRERWDRGRDGMVGK